MSWALKNNRFIHRAYHSDFLLTTTSFIPLIIMMNEIGVSSYEGRYSGLLRLSRLHITFFSLRIFHYYIDIYIVYWKEKYTALR